MAEPSLILHVVSLSSDDPEEERLCFPLVQNDTTPIRFGWTTEAAQQGSCSAVERALGGYLTHTAAPGFHWLALLREHWDCTI
ncbi:unnamed protein product [Arctogadus glacialis]